MGEATKRYVVLEVEDGGEVTAVGPVRWLSHGTIEEAASAVLAARHPVRVEEDDGAYDVAWEIGGEG